ncbi:hypothetical protein [Chryseobacterium gwangjuense]|uniref:hypothetical protein n=1 Tax=Chryseobacterium gwangjuense TaxID=1069980 RepID=UPI001E42A383|nr:hypothetical protein [Chryseobacterium gwangjuense]MCE3077291.1 hypothetical protein [Chryseobacterium gwangjuense]
MKINTYLFSIKSILTVLLIIINSLIKGQTVTVSGTDWSPTIPTITEAGSNYAGSYESASSQILISMTIPGLLLVGSSANISVNYEANPLWNNNLILERKRTGAGINGSVCILCSVSGGDTNYQTITTTPLVFFTLSTGVGLGTNTRNNIPVQIRLSGVSVTVPVATYNAKLVFTISN